MEREVGAEEAANPEEQAEKKQSTQNAGSIVRTANWAALWGKNSAYLPDAVKGAATCNSAYQ